VIARVVRMERPLPDWTAGETPGTPSGYPAGMGRLETFLAEWLGRWPPATARDVVAHPLRGVPGWDGTVRPAVAVGNAEGRWVVSVAPGRADAPDPLDGLVLSEMVFRWTDDPAPLETLGDWLPADDPVVPAWLRPFGGDVLIVTDDDGYLAGVGLKRHLDSGWEISVGTEPRGRGRGLARRLVATAARRVVDEGRVVLYLHDPENHASAAAAVAAGIPDRGWRTLTMEADD
jgi:GNAT superfamily N-acetyltransferase